MKFPNPLVSGTILKKYKRFLIDFQLEGSSEVLTASTNSTGPMLSCWEPGWKILLAQHEDTKRKYPHSLEMTNNGHTWIGVNTILPNRLVEEAITEEKIPELAGYPTMQREVRYGMENKSKIDLLLSNNGEERCYVEIKCTNYRPSMEEAVTEFPDTRSLRAEQHLEELHQVAKNGDRAVLLFLVMREDCEAFRPCEHKAPEYVKRLREIQKEGTVEFLAYQCQLTPTEIVVSHRLPMI